MNSVLGVFVLLVVAVYGLPRQQAKGFSSDCQTANRASIENLIVGGTEANRYEFKFIGSLRSGSSATSSSHICGGSLVKSDTGRHFFVTAAHCVYGGNANRYFVKFGSHFRVGNSDNGQIVSVSRIVSHPGYNSQTLVNDIAVLVLSAAVIENSRVKPICYASRGYTNNEQSTVIGWGTLSQGGSSPPNLMKVNKPILSASVCKNAENGFVASSMLCAGDLQNGGIDACQGDSGGPLFCQRGSVYELVGVVSWGRGCAQKNNPGIYADAKKLESFVVDTMAANV